MLTTLSGGEATAADLNVIRQFLKDNKIEAAAVQDNPLDKLAKTLPFQSATDDAEDYLPN